MADIKIPRSLADDAAHKIALRIAGERAKALPTPEELVELYVKAYGKAQAKFEAEVQIDETK